MSTHDAEFVAGRKEGEVDARLKSQYEHLQRLNGRVAKLADTAGHLATELRNLASEIRTLQEEGRLAEERVDVARKTLATETERRREELAVTATALSTQESNVDRKFSKREKQAGVIVPVLVALLGFYLKSKHII